MCAASHFQVQKESFHHGVVPAISFSAHASDQAVLAKQVAVCMARGRVVTKYSTIRTSSEYWWQQQRKWRFWRSVWRYRATAWSTQMRFPPSACAGTDIGRIHTDACVEEFVPACPEHGLIQKSLRLY